MDRVDVTFNLPQELVEQAQAAGLLTDAQIERWLTDELDRQGRVNRFFDQLDQLAKIEPPLSPQEIDAEIESYRLEKRSAKSASQDANKDQAE